MDANRGMEKAGNERHPHLQGMNRKSTQMDAKNRRGYLRLFPGDGQVVIPGRLPPALRQEAETGHEHGVAPKLLPGVPP
jgi:hypothetical protein